MDPEKYRRIIENPNADLVDFRDAKIVDLAKKSRKLQVRRAAAAVVLFVVVSCMKVDSVAVCV